MAVIDRTVQAVFDKAIYLIDAQGESGGDTVNSDTAEYRIRAIGLLNTLLDKVYTASDTYAITEDGKRPYLGDITSFEDTLKLDARILRDVLPCGLAALLLSEENPSLANFFQQRFEEGLYESKATRPATFEDIDMPYGHISHGSFSRWL